MNIEKQLLWIIPNKDYNDRGLEDGKPILYPMEIGNSDHITKTQDFCTKYGLSNYPPLGGSHDDWGKYFTELGFAVVFNSGITIDNKYFCGIYLPKQLTSKQIEFFEIQKENFYSKYHISSSFFGIRILPDGELEYKSTNGFRDLKIEAMIDGKPTDNGIDLFYDEINSQKDKLNNLGK